MDKIKVKNLNNAIQVMVGLFSEQVQPYAFQLTNTLLESFWEQIQKTEQQDNEDQIENIDQID